MDESRVNQAGATPIKPMLAEIDAIKDQASSAEDDYSLCRTLESRCPFGLNAASDNHNPSQVIADVQAGGLGLPDRDYYLKTEERFKEARAQYLVHVANMFQLAGYTPEAARKLPHRSCNSRLRWRRPLWTTSPVAIHRPSTTRPPMPSYSSSRRTSIGTRITKTRTCRG